MSLHKIRVDKISSFLLNKHSVHNFRLLAALALVDVFTSEIGFRTPKIRRSDVP